MKPGSKPKGKVKIEWSPEFAYAIGLITTDGCLLNDGRHIDITSKDRDQLENILHCLKIKVKIGTKGSGSSKKRYYRVQFGDVLFYKFLLAIGLTPAKSRTLGEIDIPKKYFFDFLRGSFDGDGTFYSYYDPRWRSSFMFYTCFISASERYIVWIRKEIQKRIHIKGHINYSGRKKSTLQIKYGKRESLKILKAMYYSKHKVCLKRKRLKIEKALAIVGLTI